MASRFSKYRNFIIILIVNFCHQMGQQMNNTLVPKYASSLGSSAYLVGLVTSAFAVSSLITRPITSPAFDSFQQKKLLIAALIGIFASYVGFAFSNTLTALFIARLLQGVCVGCAAPLSLALASRLLPDDMLGKGISIFSLCQAVGQAVGPGFGLAMTDRIGYRWTFLIGAACVLLAIFFATFIQEPQIELAPYRFSLNRIIEKDALSATGLMFFLMFAYACLNTFLAIYGGILGIKNIGLYFTVYAVLLLLTRPISGILIDRYGYGRILVPGILCFATSFLIIGYAKTLPHFLIAAAVNACGYGVCYPAVQSMSMNCVAKERRGAAAGTSYLGSDFAMLIGPFVAGLLVDTVTVSSGSAATAYATMFRLMAIPVCAAAVVFLLSRKNIQAAIDRNSCRNNVVVPD